MNKKILMCAAIATALLFTACAKKESPNEDDREQTVETKELSEETVNLEALEDQDNDEIPPRVEVEHQESNNTSATIRREYSDASDDELYARADVVSNSKPAATEAKPQTENKPKAETPAPSPKASSSTSQTEDDAVAAAIAAATPALDN